LKAFKLKMVVLAISLGVSSSVFAGLVNINKANSEALAHHLTGVGQKKAEAIVKYRSEHGAFTDAEDLVNVKGIGEGILNKNIKDISLTSGAVALAKNAELPEKLEKMPAKAKKAVMISDTKPSKEAKTIKSSEKKVVAKADDKKLISMTKKKEVSKVTDKSEK